MGRFYLQADIFIHFITFYLIVSTQLNSNVQDISLSSMEALKKLIQLVRPISRMKITSIDKRFH